MFFQYFCYTLRFRWGVHFLFRRVCLHMTLSTFLNLETSLKIWELTIDVKRINKSYIYISLTIFLARVRSRKYESDAKTSSFRFCKTAYWKYNFLAKEWLAIYSSRNWSRMSRFWNGKIWQNTNKCWTIMIVIWSVGIRGIF